MEESSRSLSGTMKRVKEALEKFGHPKHKRQVHRELDHSGHQIPTLGSVTTGTIECMEELFARTPVIDVSDAVKCEQPTASLGRWWRT